MEATLNFFSLPPPFAFQINSMESLYDRIAACQDRKRLDRGEFCFKYKNKLYHKERERERVKKLEEQRHLTFAFTLFNTNELNLHLNQVAANAN